MDRTRLLSKALVDLDSERVATPAFVVDRQALRKNLSILGEVQSRAGCRILLALKGFAAHCMAKDVRDFLPGVAASSPHEARLGKEEFGGEVHTYSPAYLPAGFKDVMAYSDTIIFNSFKQWRRHRSEIRTCARDIEVGLRINPEHSEVSTPIYDPCAPGSRLGVTRKQFEGESLEGISGLHFHTLCELGSDALERTLNVVEDQFGEFFSKISWVNMGGGHHITRPDYDRERLVKLITEFRARTGLRVLLEPGEAIALDTGVLVGSVLDITTNGNVDNAILDISATCHMPDVLEMPYRPEIIGAGEPGEKAHTYRLGGPSCLAGDIVGDYSFDAPLSIGDKLVFLDMAIYSMVKTSNFNGVQLPDIVVYDNEDDSFRLVRRFGYESYRDRLS